MEETRSLRRRTSRSRHPLEENVMHMSTQTSRRFRQPGENTAHTSTQTLFEDEVSASEIGYTSKLWLVVLAFYFGVFCLVWYCDVYRTPAPVLISDVEKLNVPRNRIFSEERAKNFLLEMSSIGPKPTGSYENEVLAVDYLTNLLSHFKSVSKDKNDIEVDVQKVSGCFPLDFKDGMTSCYTNVKNVVVKIGPRNVTKKSLLVNCHFDSVPTSPGASDDLASCAVMLEVLLALSQSEQTLDYPVIFLFNGAEENILQAAHGFITKHKWAKDVVGFINLEACGSGGKQMLFQTSNNETWVFESYARSASYPYGSVIAQDIFTSGLIPSDTDYRIFEQFGRLPGLDFAYVKNGYIYHTKYDAPEYINPGALQQSGDNLLQLIHDILQSPAMKESVHIPSEHYVFFDFLGFKMISYTTKTASAANVLIAVLVIVELLTLNYHEIGWSLATGLTTTFKVVLFMFLNLVAALAVNVATAGVLHLNGSTMSWYSKPFLVAGLYGCPSLAVMVFMHGYVKKLMKRVHAEDCVYQAVFFAAGRVTWVILLALMQAANLHSSFICCAWILFPGVLSIVWRNICQLCHFRMTLNCYAVQLLLVQLVPLVLLMYCMWSIYTVFIPIMGRIGALLNPDVLIGVLTAVFVFLSTIYVLSLVQLTGSVCRVVSALAAVFILTLCLVCFTPVGFPYTGNPQSPAPMRAYVLHTARKFWNSSDEISKDSGYWVVPLDYNGPSLLQKYIPGMKESDIVDCHADLACGMPFYMPVVSLLRKTYYVRGPLPRLHYQKKFTLVAKEYVGPQLQRLDFEVIGPDHMTVILSPRNDTQLVEWSLYAGSPLPGLPWKNRKTYFIYYSHGEFTGPWKFSLVFKVPKNFSVNATVVDMMFATHYLHGHAAVSEEFQSVLDRIPNWIHVTPWTSTLDMYTF